MRLWREQKSIASVPRFEVTNKGKQMRSATLARLLVPVLAAVVAGCGGSQSGDADSTAASSVGSSTVAGAGSLSRKGYSITPAEGWTENSTAMAGQAELVLMAKPQDAFAANLNVVIMPGAAGESLQAAKEQMPAMYAKMFNKYTPIEQADLSVDGAPAISNTATHETGTPPRKLWMHQVFAIKGDKAYTFTCTSLDSNHAQNKAAFDSMISSVKWAS
jgi:hypothetical protein